MSENYIVSARKYRPSSFDTVVGQHALTHTLKTAIMSQRLAHAYLFCGPRGVGKTTCARIFAKAINCEHLGADGEPCGECESCRAFNEQRSYNIIELDAASNNSVNDMRNIIDQVRVPPQVGRYRVFIIDEVHMLSPSAFNAFLKTLEEPPEYVIFILATTEKQKIIPTILSRCQIYDFARIGVPDIVEQLQRICRNEGIEAEPAALNVIAQKADGAMRDALSIFDQITASSEGHITYQSAIDNLNVLDYDYYFRLDKCFIKGDVPQALLIYKEIRDHGFDSLFFINGLAQHIRDLMVASSPQTVSLLEMNDDVAKRHVAAASQFTPQYFYAAMDLCNRCDLDYRTVSNKVFLVELTLIKLCQLMSPSPSPGSTGGHTPLKSVTPQPQSPQSPAKAAPQAPARPQAAAAPARSQVAAAVQRPVQPVARPAAAGRAMHVSAPPGQAQTAAPGLGLHISRAPGQTQQPQAAKPVAQVASQHGRASFTADQLKDAWMRYIEKFPDRVVLVNAMRNSMPARIDDESYLFEVDNEGQVDIIGNNMSHLLSFLRTELGNEMVSIKVSLRKSGPRPKVWTDREVIENLKKTNPDFVKMVGDFGLTLS